MAFLDHRSKKHERKTVSIFKLKARYVLSCAYALYLSLLLDRSKVNLTCENSTGKNICLNKLFMKFLITSRLPGVFPCRRYFYVSVAEFEYAAG